MNLSQIKLKLFEVKVSNPTAIDHLGAHIGDNMPKLDTLLEYRENLYICGETIDQATKFLAKHKIHAVIIKELDILLDAREETLEANK